MFTASFQYYPSGVRIPLTQGFKAETLVDPEWAQLKARLNNHKLSGDSIEYHKEVVRITKRLFGNLLSWLDAQDQNTRLSVNTYEYLKDTLLFLNKGYRVVSKDSRISLINADFSHNQTTNPKAESRKERLRDLVQFDPNEFIFIWTNHPNGWSDMICTVDLLFGTDLAAR